MLLLPPVLTFLGFSSVSLSLAIELSRQKKLDGNVDVVERLIKGGMGTVWGVISGEQTPSRRH